MLSVADVTPEVSRPVTLTRERQRISVDTPEGNKGVVTRFVDPHNGEVYFVGMANRTPTQGATWDEIDSIKLRECVDFVSREGVAL